MRTCIVTGASSGLGREFARRISKNCDIDSVWVIARRKQRLEEFTKLAGVKAVLLPLDLTKPESIERLRELLEEKKPDVRFLVNAAGFGKTGRYKEIFRQDTDSMIDLNCKALVDVTLTVLPYMKKGARIIEISSVAAFQPLPSFNVYAASKAFVLSYSRSLRWELFGRGIHVTAVCPYWIKDTEFIETSGKSADKDAVKHFPLASRVNIVVGLSMFASKINLPVATPGIISFLIRIVTKFIPREIITAVWEVLRRI